MGDVTNFNYEEFTKQNTRLKSALESACSMFRKSKVQWDVALDPKTGSTPMKWMTETRDVVNACIDDLTAGIELCDTLQQSAKRYQEDLENFANQGLAGGADL